MNARGFSTIAVWCLLALAVPAVAQTVVFHADFNTDTPESPPDIDPAGDPDGDYLVIFNSGGTVLVEPEFVGLTDQPVVLTRDPGGTVAIQCFTDPDYRDCENYTVSWKEIVDIKLDGAPWRAARV